MADNTITVDGPSGKFTIQYSGPRPSNEDIASAYEAHAATKRAASPGTPSAAPAAPSVPSAARQVGAGGIGYTMRPAVPLAGIKPVPASALPMLGGAAPMTAGGQGSAESAGGLPSSSDMAAIRGQNLDNPEYARFDGGYRPPTAAEAVSDNAFHGFLPSVAGFAAAPFGGLFGGIPGAIAFGTGASTIAQDTQDAVLKAMSPGRYANLQRRLQTEQQQYPYQTAVGNFLPQLALMKPGIPTKAMLPSMALGAGIQSGMEALNEFHATGAVDPKMALFQGALGGLGAAGGTNRFGEAVMAPGEALAARYPASLARTAFNAATGREAPVLPLSPDIAAPTSVQTTASITPSSPEAKTNDSLLSEASDSLSKQASAQPNVNDSSRALKVYDSPPADVKGRIAADGITGASKIGDRLYDPETKTVSTITHFEKDNSAFTVPDTIDAQGNVVQARPEQQEQPGQSGQAGKAPSAPAPSGDTSAIGIQNEQDMSKALQTHFGQDKKTSDAIAAVHEAFRKASGESESDYYGRYGVTAGEAPVDSGGKSKTQPDAELLVKTSPEQSGSSKSAEFTDDEIKNRFIKAISESKGKKLQIDEAGKIAGLTPTQATVASTLGELDGKIRRTFDESGRYPDHFEIHDRKPIVPNPVSDSKKSALPETLPATVNESYTDKALFLFKAAIAENGKVSAYDRKIVASHSDLTAEQINAIEKQARKEHKAGGGLLSQENSGTDSLNQSGTGKQTDTPAFKSWFGDSKVVDEKGEPLTMYHGTPTPGHNEFRLGKDSGLGLFGNGYYFTDNPDIAAEYADNRGTGTGDRPGIYPLHLSIQKPFNMEAGIPRSEALKLIKDGVTAVNTQRRSMGDETAYTNAGLKSAISEKLSRFTPDQQTIRGEDVWDVLKEFGGGSLSSHGDKARGNRYAQDAVKGLGYDGISHIGGGRYFKGDTNRHQVFVAFDSNQIKSSIGNRGTFDPTDANILHQPDQAGIDGNPNRAAIEFKPNNRTVLRALSSPDASSGIHEAAHGMRRDLFRIVRDKGSLNGITSEDLAHVERWAGVESGAKWHTEGEEKFARAFEGYLMEGKAPTEVLRKVFSHLKDALMGVYKAVRGTASDPSTVPISPEVRVVFDKMLGGGTEAITEATPTEAGTTAETAPTAPPALNTSSIKMDDLEARAEALGIPVKDRAEYARTFADVQKAVDENRVGLYHSLMGKNVDRGDRLTTEEMQAGGDRLKALDDKELPDLLAKVEDATKSGNEPGAIKSRAALNAALDEYGEIHKRLHKEGSERGRALAMQKLLVDKSELNAGRIIASLEKVSRKPLSAEAKETIVRQANKGKLIEKNITENVNARASAAESRLKKNNFATSTPAAKPDRAALIEQLRRAAAGDNGGPDTLNQGGVNPSGATGAKRNPQVDTPEFKRFFGDSKVVDEKGEPLVVYHGSPDVRAIFNEGFKGFSRGEVFFASDRYDTANTYADDRRALDYQNAEAHVVPLYVSLKNPLVIDTKGQHWRNTESFVKQAKEAGHDGIIIHNSVDDYNNTSKSKSSTVYAWFNSTQAKSAIEGQLKSRYDGAPITNATGNRGTFDASDPNILHQSTAPVSLREAAVALGVHHIENGTKKYAEWAKEMRADMGADASAKLSESDLQGVWRDSRKQVPGEVDKATNLVTRGAERSIGNMEAGYPKAVPSFNKDIVSVGVREYASGAKDLVAFGRTMKKALGPHIDDATLQQAFTEAAQQYKTDYRALDNVKKVLGNTLQSEAYRNLPIAAKLYGGAVNVINAGRSLTTSFDLSAPFRQGSFLTFANPKLAAKSFAPMIKAFGNEEFAQQVDAAIRTRPNAPEYERAGLNLSDADDDVSLTAGEELFRGKLAEKIPGVGHIVRGSERAYTTYLNKLRADTFDTLASTVTGNGSRAMTDEEAKALGNFINVATGRGTGKIADGIANVLNGVMFSPRYAVSRFQVAAGQPIFAAKNAPTAQRVIARTYLQYAGSVATILGMAQLSKQFGADVDVEKDPRSKNFGKIRVGGVQIDIHGGLQQVIVFSAELASKQIKGQGAKVRPVTGEDVLRFGRGKLSPSAGSLVDAYKATPKAPYGADYFGQSVSGPKNDPWTAVRYYLGKNVAPMSIADFYSAAHDSGIPRAAVVGLLSMFGFGVRNLDNKERDSMRRDVAAPTLYSSPIQGTAPLTRKLYRSPLRGLLK